jgi:AbrB family looped-hinge helix DNA binding protein
MAESEQIVTLGPQGRIVIPASIRRDLDLREGSTLALRVEGRRLVIETRGEILERLRRRYAQAGPTSLSKELIEDRRKEARRESRR